MAWLDKRRQNYRLLFQVGAQTFKRSPGTLDRRQPEGLVAVGKPKTTPTVNLKPALTLAATVEL